MNEVLKIAAIIREAAEKEVLPRFGKVSAQTKDMGKFKENVTEADLKSSEYILERVRKMVPGSYSEEHLHEDRFSHDVIWQFDPIDGTDEYLAEFADGYAIDAARLQRGADGRYFPNAGIIYLPGLDHMWIADGSKIIFLKEGKEVPIPKLKRETLRGWVRKVDSDESLSLAYESIARELGLNSKIFLGGGAGSAFAALFEGRLDLFIINMDMSKEWDVAMAEPFIKAFGGFICDLEGNEFTYNRKNFVNKNGVVASIVFKKDEILPLLPKDLLVRS